MVTKKNTVLFASLQALFYFFSVTNALLAQESISKGTYPVHIFESNIAGDAIVMHLVLTDTVADANCYYTNKKESFILNGSFKNGKLEMAVYSDELPKEAISAQFKGQTLSGKWLKPGVKDWIPCEFVERKPVKDMGQAVFIGQRYTHGFQKKRKKTNCIAFYSQNIICPTFPENAALTQRVQKEWADINGLKQGLPIEAALKCNADSFITEYKDLLKESDFFFGYDAQIQNYLYYNDRQLLCMGLFIYTYTGGAHPNSSSGAVVWDLATQNIIQLADWVEPSKKNALDELLNAKFKKLRPDEVEYLLTPLQANENFHITPSQICFTYVPYEILPYASGYTEISITWEELAPFMKEDAAFHRLLKP